MSDPFLGHIMLAGFNFPPHGYALCDGSLLQLSQNQALYALLGKNYGGNGQTNYALPDLRGRTPIGMNYYNNGRPNYAIAASGGQEGVSLSATQIPAHQHLVNGSSIAGTKTPTGNVYSSVGPVGTKPTYPLYAAPDTMVGLGNPVSSAGGGGAHENMQPFLVLNYAIATSGTWPPRT